MIQIISAVIECLMKIDNYAYPPKANYAREFQFRNTKAMIKNTEIIPDSVAEQLDNHFHELGSNYRLIYEILKDTGLRLKEVIFLEADCLTESKVDKKYYVLEYTPYKILNKLKLSGKPCKQIVLINALLANKLYLKIKMTESLRVRSESNYIFLSQKTKARNSIDIAMAQESNYVDAVNRIIKKHNILGEDGELWYYTARQARKTLAVIMADNGATSQEIASQLGQHDKRTTEKFYAEVRKKRMAQLNSDYYKKKFALYVGDENLKQYSEEERRQLYVDFAMNVREVEFGQCSKHISEGPCGKRVGKSNCATCPKLCTGKKYLNKWIELRDSQKYIIDALIKAYKHYNITDYEGFVEYRKEMKLLSDYQAVIDKINEKEGK
ncbi:tyrosine-type recombinase/integrase [Anaerosporobacter sp.]